MEYIIAGLVGAIWSFALISIGMSIGQVLEAKSMAKSARESYIKALEKALKIDK
jgi:hypothetical protein